VWLNGERQAAMLVRCRADSSAQESIWVKGHAVKGHAVKGACWETAQQQQQQQQQQQLVTSPAGRFCVLRHGAAAVDASIIPSANETGQKLQKESFKLLIPRQSTKFMSRAAMSLIDMSIESRQFVEQSDVNQLYFGATAPWSLESYAGTMPPVSPLSESDPPLPTLPSANVPSRLQSASSWPAATAMADQGELETDCNVPQLSDGGRLEMPQQPAGTVVAHTGTSQRECGLKPLHLQAEHASSEMWEQAALNQAGKAAPSRGMEPGSEAADLVQSCKSSEMVQPGRSQAVWPNDQTAGECWGGSGGGSGGGGVARKPGFLKTLISFFVCGRPSQ
jgi:hypothetical protein